MTQLTFLSRDFRSLPRSQRHKIRRRVRRVVSLLAIVFGSMGLAALAWQIFVMPYAKGF